MGKTKKKVPKGAFGGNTQSPENSAAGTGAQAAPPSKKALRQQRQRANAQKRKAQLLAEGAAADVKKRKGINLTSVVIRSLGNTAFREEHSITVEGASSDPFETFDDAKGDLGKALMRQMNRQGYTQPMPIQAEIWPLALQGHDIVAVAETGSGKTLAFLLPILARISQRGLMSNDALPVRPASLVLAPTRELVQQIRLEVNKFLVGEVETRPRVVALFGGVDKQEQIKKLRKGADLVVATPGRLLDLVADDKEGPYVALDKVTYLALDEADRMLDMGFEEDIQQIVSHCPKSGKPAQGGGASGEEAATRRQTLFFTATWPDAVKETAESLVGKRAVQVRIGKIAVGDGLTVSGNVTQVVSVVEEDEKLSRLKKLLSTELAATETAIVFAAKKSSCNLIEEELNTAKACSWCGVLHSGKEQKERSATLRKFRDATCGETEGRAVLVATDVAARGLDIPGVAVVVIFDCSGGIDKYVHRIGRTGRSGKPGRAFTFFTAEDEGAEELVELLEGANQKVPLKLASLVSQTRSTNGKIPKHVDKSSTAGAANVSEIGSETSGRGRGTSLGGRGSGRGRGYG